MPGRAELLDCKKTSGQMYQKYQLNKKKKRNKKKKASILTLQ